MRCQAVKVVNALEDQLVWRKFENDRHQGDNQNWTEHRENSACNAIAGLGRLLGGHVPRHDKSHDRACGCHAEGGQDDEVGKTVTWRWRRRNGRPQGNGQEAEAQAEERVTKDNLEAPRHDHPNHFMLEIGRAFYQTVE